MTTYNASIIFLSFEDDFHFEKYFDISRLTKINRTDNSLKKKEKLAILS
jgi:hypothetical protein